MALREQIKTPRFQVQIGLVFLIIASLSKWFVQPRVSLPDEWTDGMTGLLYGIAIGFMLLGTWRKNRPDRSDE